MLSPLGYYRDPNSSEGGTFEDLRRGHLQSHKRMVLLYRTFASKPSAVRFQRLAAVGFLPGGKPLAASAPFERVVPPATPEPFQPPDSWGATAAAVLAEAQENSG